MKMINIVNTTPHIVNILRMGEWYTLSPSESPVRIDEITTVIGSINGVTLVRKGFSEPVNLPDPAPDTYYIVSTIVASALPRRADLLVPSDFLRDEQGNILGCKCLAKLSTDPATDPATDPVDLTTGVYQRTC